MESRVHRHPGRPVLLITALLITALLLAGCVTAPREPAARLADAGMQATASFGSDTSALAAQVANGGVAGTFVERWQLCTASPANCGLELPVDPNVMLRLDLAKIIQLRAAALAELNQAYAALKQEAEYDARTHMRGAVNEAVASTNGFAAAAFSLAGMPSTQIPATVGNMVAFAGGLIADQRQKGRILAANAKLREVTQRLHDGLAAEAQVFDRIADPIAQRRTDTTLILYDEGLLDGSQLIKPMMDSLEMPVPPGIGAKMAASPALRAAVRDAVRAQRQLEAVRSRARYRASLSALQALVVEHDNLAQERSVSLTEVGRMLGEVNALLQPASAPPGADDK